MIEPSNSTQGISWLKGRGEAHQSQGDYDRAIADFEQVIELDPKYTTPYNKRAWAYYAKGNFDHAIVEYDQSTKLDPKDPTAFNGRARARMRLKATTSAQLPITIRPSGSIRNLATHFSVAASHTFIWANWQKGWLTSIELTS